MQSPPGYRMFGCVECVLFVPSLLAFLSAAPDFYFLFFVFFLSFFQLSFVLDCKCCDTISGIVLPDVFGEGDLGLKNKQMLDFFFFFQGAKKTFSTFLNLQTFVCLLSKVFSSPHPFLTTPHGSGSQCLTYLKHGALLQDHTRTLSFS